MDSLVWNVIRTALETPPPREEIHVHMPDYADFVPLDSVLVAKFSPHKALR